MSSLEFVKVRNNDETSMSSLQNVCVCCLDNNIPLILLENCRHVKMYTALINAKLKNTNVWICNLCHHMMIKCFEFKRQALTSYEVLFAMGLKLDGVKKTINLITSHPETIDIDGHSAKGDSINDNYEIDDNYDEISINAPVTTFDVFENKRNDIKKEISDEDENEQIDTAASNQITVVKIESLSQPTIKSISESFVYFNEAENFKETDNPLSLNEGITPGSKDQTKKNSENKSDYIKAGKVNLKVLANKEFEEKINNDALKPAYLHLPYKCTDCLVSFDYEEMLNKHMEDMHDEKIGDYLCTICNTYFNYKSVYDIHVASHYKTDKVSITPQTSETNIQTIQEDLCKLSECRDLKNTKIYNNFEHSSCSEDFTHRCSENPNRYVDLHQDFNLEVHSSMAKDLNQRIDLAIPSIKNDIYDNYERSPLSNYDGNEHEQESESNGNECDLELDIEILGNAHSEQNECNKNTNEQEKDTDVSNKEKRKKKTKKKSFEKIVLSYDEQKSKLEAARKEKNYLESEYKCYSCALGFLFKDTYQSHMVRHEESNGQFSCNICGLRFATQNAKCMHVVLHSELYRCNKCNLIIKRPHRNRHIRCCWEGGAEVASCHLCGKSFSDTNYLQQHLKRFHAWKTSNKVYSCSLCAKIYKTQAGVRTHMIKHISARFKCAQCPSSFASPYTLNQHKKTHTTPAPSGQHTCLACNKHFSCNKYLVAHLKNAAVHRGDVVTCHNCRRHFSSQSSYLSHVCLPRDKTRSCDVCGAVCPSRYSLRRHTLTRHTAGRDDSHQCHLCGKKFQDTSKLNRHLKEVCEKAKMEEQLAELYEQEL